MITKERLQELIEQGATIYIGFGSPCYEIIIDKTWNIEKDTHLKRGSFYVQLKFLFETKEDAEEYAEFGNITRTERLELPSWGEVNHKERIFVYKFHIKDNFDGFGKLMIIKDFINYHYYFNLNSISNYYFFIKLLQNYSSYMINLLNYQIII